MDSVKWPEVCWTVRCRFLRGGYAGGWSPEIPITRSSLGSKETTTNQHLKQYPPNRVRSIITCSIMLLSSVTTGCVYIDKYKVLCYKCRIVFQEL